MNAVSQTHPQLVPVPIPDKVAALIGRQVPKNVLQAEVEATNQAYCISLCRKPEYAEAREHALSELHRANKVLAKYHPKLPVRPNGVAE